MSIFSIKKTNEGTRARLGELTIGRGITLPTPVFMPVGTAATVKAMRPEDLEEIGYRLILGNTYHLHLRPGEEIIERLGGLHTFMGWDRAILTDSGGFQVFSLARINRISEEGVAFQSHIDGTHIMLSPERSMEIQMALGSDIVMVFDECPPYPSEKEYVEKSLHLTDRWGKRSKVRFDEMKKEKNGTASLFGIIQGGTFDDLRVRSLELTLETGFDGLAIGGLSVGEPQAMIYEAVDRLTPHMPLAYPRYTMGVGKPEDLVTLVDLGIDMFDCVIPTRNARNGTLFTATGDIDIRNARFRDDPGPIDESCRCATCKRFSRAYLRHLLTNKEILGSHLATVHNLYYYARLMNEMRVALTEGNFIGFKSNFMASRVQNTNV